MVMDAKVVKGYDIASAFGRIRVRRGVFILLTVVCIIMLVQSASAGEFTRLYTYA